MISSAKSLGPIFLFSSIRKRRFPAAAHKGRFRIPVHVLCLITEGEGILLIDGVLSKIYPLQLYLFKPGTTIELPDQCSGFTYFGAFFEPLALIKANGLPSVQKDDQAIAGRLSAHIPIQHPQQVLQQFLQLYEAARSCGSGEQLKLRLLFEQFMHSMLSEETPPPPLTDSRIEQSIVYISQNYTNKMNLKQISEAAGMPTLAFSRTFRQATGMAPLEYVNQIRLDNAKRLLAQSQCRVKEVAASVGFRSEFYFSRIFQKVVGVSPTVYMKRGSLQVAVASSLGFHEHLEALGIKPVCVVDMYSYPGIETQEHEAKLHEQMEQLKQSAPELILTDHYHTEGWLGLKQVATNVCIDSDGWNWKRNFTKIAELMNKEQAAELMLSRLELRISDVRQQLRQLLGTGRITVIQVNHKGIGIQGTVSHPLNELLYLELGLHPGAEASDKQWREEMEPERLPLLEAEHLFVHLHHRRAGSEQVFERMTNTNSWQQIAAAAQTQVTFIDNWFVKSWTLQGRLHIMDELIGYAARSFNR
jgi:AraC-like DNA-binding protein